MEPPRTLAEVHEFACECGKPLHADLTSHRTAASFVVFCDHCYLNHRFEWHAGKPRLAQRYYFPDD